MLSLGSRQSTVPRLATWYLGTLALVHWHLVQYIGTLANWQPNKEPKLTQFHVKISSKLKNKTIPSNLISAEHPITCGCTSNVQNRKCLLTYSVPVHVHPL